MSANTLTVDTVRTQKHRAGPDEPFLYKVVLHNDDYTTMDFVVMILEHVFGKNAATAARIMLDVHRQGAGVAGVYTREVAETKIEQVRGLARKNGFPLKCSLEKV